MSDENLKERFLEAAAAVLKSPSAEVGEQRTPWLAPEVHDLASQVARKAGMAYPVAVRRKVFNQLFPGLRSPVLAARLRVILESAAPEEYRAGVAVSVEEGKVVPLGEEAWAVLLDSIQSAKRRLPAEEFDSLFGTIQRHVGSIVGNRAEEHKAKLLTLQSRKRRELESVYHDRLMELEEFGEDQGDGDGAVRLVAEKRQALGQVDRHFDPNEMRVRVRATLLLLVGVYRSGKSPAAGEEDGQE